MDDLTAIATHIPAKYQWLSMAFLFAISHADRAYRSLVSVGGLKGLATTIWYGERANQTKQTPSTSSEKVL